MVPWMMDGSLQSSNDANQKPMGRLDRLESRPSRVIQRIFAGHHACSGVTSTMSQYGFARLIK